MIICKTPLRISFAGGGTDIDSYYRHGYGAVVSTAIDKYIYVTIHRRYDNTLRVGYTKTEIVAHADELSHTRMRACLNLAGIDNGIEITTIGDIPSGTGMGSSSTLTVGLLNALYNFKGEHLSSEELLFKAYRVEREILQEPLGKQDQAAAAYGGLNYFQFMPDGTVHREPLMLSESELLRLESKLLLFYTGLTHQSKEILKNQNARIEANMDALDRMRNQARDMRVRLRREPIGSWFGEMMRQGWELKKSLTGEISNPLVDDLYRRALSAGAVGGKLLGAGGGGFLLLYCEENTQANLRKAMGLRELPFRFDRYGSRIVYFD